MIRKPLRPLFVSLASAMALTWIQSTAALAQTPAPNVLFAGPISADQFEIIEANGASLVSGGVEADSSASDSEWHEFIRTLPEKTSLKPNKTYKFSYDYTVTKVGGEKTQFYHMLRSVDAKKDIAGETWADAAGSKGHKEWFADLGSPTDFRFIIGIRFKGALRIENLRIEEIADPAAVVLPTGVLFTGPLAREKRIQVMDGAKFVSGGVEVDTTAKTNEWHEFFRTVPETLKFAPNKSYKISYDYTVQKVGDGTTEFYHFVRPTENENSKGWETWVEPAGSKGHKEFTVELDSAVDYKLIFGIHFKGAIRIENLNIAEAH